MVGGSSNHGKVSGGTPVTVLPGQPVSSAMFAAIMQSVYSGNQSLVINRSGIAVGGIVNFKSENVQGLGSLVVPKNVSLNAIGYSNSSPLNIAGALVNYGSINLVQNKTGLTSALSAGALSVAGGAQITGSTSSGHLSPSAQINLNLSGDLNNNGLISCSKGNLQITAAGGINNLNSGSSKATVSAQNLSIITGSGKIINSGLLQGVDRVSFNTTDANTNLSLNNNGGTLSSKGSSSLSVKSHNSGVITFRNDGTNLTAANVSLSGGKVDAPGGLNLFGSDLETHVTQLIGAINNTGANANVSVKAGHLTVGKQTLSGDPSYYNSAGDIAITSLSGIDGDIAIVASGNITTSAATTIQTTAANSSIFMSAGFNFTTSDASTSGGPAATVLTFTGTSNPGMNINAEGNQLNLAATGNGNITMMATGSINMGAGAISTNSGNVLIMAGGGINGTQGSVATTSGNVGIHTANPANFTGLTITNGTTSALPTVGTNTNAAIAMPVINTNTGAVTVSGGDILLDNINAGTGSSVVISSTNTITQTVGTVITADTVSLNYASNPINLALSTGTLQLTGNSDATIFDDQSVAMSVQIGGTFSMTGSSSIFAADSTISATNGISLYSLDGSISVSNSSLTSSSGPITINAGNGTLLIDSGSILSAATELAIIDSTPATSTALHDVRVGTNCQLSAPNVTFANVVRMESGSSITGDLITLGGAILIGSTITAGSLKSGTIVTSPTPLNSSDIASNGQINVSGLLLLMSGAKVTTYGGDLNAGRLELEDGTSLAVNGGNLNCSNSMQLGITSTGTGSQLNVTTLDGGKGNIVTNGVLLLGGSQVVAGGSITVGSASNPGQVGMSKGTSLIACATREGTLTIFGKSLGVGEENSWASQPDGSNIIVNTPANGITGATMKTVTGDSPIIINATVVLMNESSISAAGDLTISGISADANTTITAGAPFAIIPGAPIQASNIIQPGNVTIINGGLLPGTVTAYGGNVTVTTIPGLPGTPSTLWLARNAQITAAGGNVVMQSAGDLTTYWYFGDPSSHAVITAIAQSGSKYTGGVELGAGVSTSTLHKAQQISLPSINPSIAHLGTNVVLNNANGAGGVLVIHNNSSLNSVNLNVTNSAVINESNGGAVVLDTAQGYSINLYGSVINAGVLPISQVSFEPVPCAASLAVAAFNGRDNHISVNRTSILDLGNDTRNIISAKANSEIVQKNNREISLLKGELFLYASSSTNIISGSTKISLNKGAMVSVREYQGCTTIRVCRGDARVRLQKQDSELKICAGEEAQFRDYRPSESDLNPGDGIGRRNSRTMRIASGYLTLSEFSIVSYMFNNATVRVAMKHEGTCSGQVYNGLLKTAAALNTVLNYRGAYRAN